MGDRYYITGAQIGILLAYIRNSNVEIKKFANETIKEIENKQYLGRIEECDMDSYEIKIVKRR